MSSYSYKGKSRVWREAVVKKKRDNVEAQQKHTSVPVPEDIETFIIAKAGPKTEKWDAKEMVQLLRYYGAHRCLWDLQDPDNRDQKQRKAALIDIAEAMGNDRTLKQVLKKINVMRSTYRYERRRIKQRIRNGIGAKTKLKWFALAHVFLRNVPRIEKYRKDGDYNSDSDLENAIIETVDDDGLWSVMNDEDASKKENVHDDDIDDSMNDVFTNDSAISEIIENESTNSISKFESKCTLQFVVQLKTQPALWCTKQKYSLLQKISAIQNIANQMHLPTTHIIKSLKVLKRTYNAEKLRMSADANYTPNHIWWPIADSFMEAEYTMVNANHQPSSPTLRYINEIYETENETADSVPTLNDTSNPEKTSTLSLEFAYNDVDCEPFVDETSMQIEDDYDMDNEADDSHIETEDNLYDRPDSATSNAFHSSSVLSTANEVSTLSNDEKRSANEARTLSNDATPTFSNDVLTSSSDATSTSSNDLSKYSNDVLTSSISRKIIWNGLEDDLLEGKWLLKHSVKFLRLYGAHRCLWDLNDPDYRSREMRQAAYVDIAAAMGHNLNADYVAKKIKIFRVTYMEQRKRILEEKKQGKTPEIQLKWFPLIDSFLRPHIGQRSIKNKERELPQFDFQYVYANLNLIDPTLLTDFYGKGTQNSIKIGRSK